ncbi:hypothetical protein M408DRAFT_30843 [Serendipita vermifera MAFF 305830]|uniref:C2H2-type domain-containing protein n=1 Tax=Serendipita vermifera MAFF 305830 TaxID=933852 RepID=A0A0C2W014_SERVB|nr:hypothetical protein M408DRAFT_30843 [Serendipita vermifera MAFF 305830]
MKAHDNNVPNTTSETLVPLTQPVSGVVRSQRPQRRVRHAPYNPSRPHPTPRSNNGSRPTDTSPFDDPSLPNAPSLIVDLSDQNDASVLHESTPPLDQTTSFNTDIDTLVERFDACSGEIHDQLLHLAETCMKPDLPVLKHSGVSWKEATNALAASLWAKQNYPESIDQLCDAFGRPIVIGNKHWTMAKGTRSPLAPSIHRFTAFNSMGFHTLGDSILSELKIHGSHNICLVSHWLNAFSGRECPGMIAAHVQNIFHTHHPVGKLTPRTRELTYEEELELFTANLLAGTRMTRDAAQSMDFDEAQQLNHHFLASKNVMRPVYNHSYLDVCEEHEPPERINHKLLDEVRSEAVKRIHDSVLGKKIKVDDAEVIRDHQFGCDMREHFPDDFRTVFGENPRYESHKLSTGEELEIPLLGTMHLLQKEVSETFNYSATIRHFRRHAEAMKKQCSSKKRMMGPDPQADWVYSKWWFIMNIARRGTSCPLSGTPFLLGLSHHGANLSFGKEDSETSMFTGLPPNYTLQDLRKSRPNIRCESWLSNRFAWNYQGIEFIIAFHDLVRFSSLNGDPIDLEYTSPWNQSGLESCEAEACRKDVELIVNDSILKMQAIAAGICGSLDGAAPDVPGLPMEKIGSPLLPSSINGVSSLMNMVRLHEHTTVSPPGPLAEIPRKRHLPPLPLKHFRCTHPGCNKNFLQDELAQHMKSVHQGLKPYVCTQPGCDRVFASKWYLTSHENMKHRIHPEETTGTSSHRPTTLTGPVRVELFTCAQSGCGLSFPRQNELYRHGRFHHQQSIWEATSDNPTNAVYQQGSYLGDAIDSFCLQNNVPTSPVKRIHQVICMEFEQHTCAHPECGVSFSDQRELNKHAKTHQQQFTGETTPNNLDPSATIVPPDPRPWKCTYPNCSRSYSHKSTLTKHARDHEPLSFSQQTSLHANMIQIADTDVSMTGFPPDPRPWKCFYPDCSRSYVQRGSLLRHAKDHQKIPTRPKEDVHQAVSPEFEQHMFTHPVCGQFFSEQRELTRHAKPHQQEFTGEPTSNTNANYEQQLTGEAAPSTHAETVYQQQFTVGAPANAHPQAIHQQWLYPEEAMGPSFLQTGTPDASMMTVPQSFELHMCTYPACCQPSIQNDDLYMRENAHYQQYWYPEKAIGLSSPQMATLDASTIQMTNLDASMMTGSDLHMLTRPVCGQFLSEQRELSRHVKAHQQEFIWEVTSSAHTNTSYEQQFTWETIPNTYMENQHYPEGLTAPSFPQMTFLDTNMIQIADTDVSMAIISADPKPWKCTYPNCSRSYSSKKSLRQHVKDHQGIPTRSMEDDDLDADLTTAPLDPRPWKCTHPGCDRSYAHKRTLNNHAKDHRGIPTRPMEDDDQAVSLDTFTHSVCDQSFFEQRELTKHANTRQQQFSGEAILNTHTETVHQQHPNLEESGGPSLPQTTVFVFDVNMIQMANLDASATIVPPNPRPWKCTYPNCGRSYSHKSTLTKHARDHEPFDVPTRPMNAHQAVYMEFEQHTCNHPGCGVSFSQMHDLIKHAKAHQQHFIGEATSTETNVSYEQQVTGETTPNAHAENQQYPNPKEAMGPSLPQTTVFVFDANMIQMTNPGASMAAVPPDPWPWKCTYPNCSRSYSHKNNLTKHAKSHPNIPTGPMEDVRQAVSQGFELHMCTHPGCGLSFPQQAQLNRHAKRHQ